MEITVFSVVYRGFADCFCPHRNGYEYVVCVILAI